MTALAITLTAITLLATAAGVYAARKAIRASRSIYGGKRYPEMTQEELDSFASGQRRIIRGIKDTGR